MRAFLRILLLKWTHASTLESPGTVENYFGFAAAMMENGRYRLGKLQTMEIRWENKPASPWNPLVHHFWCASVKVEDGKLAGSVLDSDNP